MNFVNPKFKVKDNNILLIRDGWWVCTKCLWEGVYSLTKGVMYRGIDWQHCPSCNSIVIPLLGKDAVLTPVETDMHSLTKSLYL